MKQMLQKMLRDSSSQTDCAVSLQNNLGATVQKELPEKATKDHTRTQSQRKENGQKGKTQESGCLLLISPLRSKHYVLKGSA